MTFQMKPQLGPEHSEHMLKVITSHAAVVYAFRIGVIQFPPEMDENWVRYGLAKLGQISKLPNWQKIVVLCVHNTTSALNS